MLVLFVLGIFALLGAVGLGIDGSRVYEERRAAQSAVDHAATAAAYSSCQGAPERDAVAAGLASALLNGYDNDSTTNTVTITAVGADVFLASISAQVSGTFSRTLGVNAFPVTVEATAGGVDCGSSSGDGLGAIFAGGTCPTGKYGVDINGSDAEIYGGIHSNGGANTSGSNARYFRSGDPDDPFTYVGTHFNGGTNNVFQTPEYPADQGSQAWPTDWAASAITGTGTGDPGADTFLKPYYDLAVANGTYFTEKVTTIDKDGVYYTTSEDGFDVGSITWSLATNDRSVVLVATRGPIKLPVSTPGKTFKWFDHADLDRKGILMLSNETFGNDDDRCSKYSINISGQGTTWEGVLWAPGGMVEFAGSNSSSVHGTLIGWSVRLSGQYIEIINESTPTGANPDVFLIK